MGLFDKIKKTLFKSRENISGKIDALVDDYKPQAPKAPYKPLPDEFYDELSDIMIMADVGVKTTNEVVDKLREKCQTEKIGDAGLAREALKGILITLMGNEPMRLNSPMVLLIIGVNGVGKTTSIGKLTTRFKTVGRRVVICAGDTFRAAAAEQLSIWAERADAPIIKQSEGADPAAVVFDGIQAAKARHADILIVDTAGRLHNKAHLMDELKKISRVCEREYPQAEVKALLVIDATTGQNGLMQAQVFKDVTSLDGIILTKLDGTAKGGIAIAIKSELGLPVRYIGIGEKLDDLEPFEAKDFIEAIF